MGSITSNIQTHIAAGSCDALDLPTKCAAKLAKRTQTIAVIYFIISIIFILNITTFLQCYYNRYLYITMIIRKTIISIGAPYFHWCLGSKYGEFSCPFLIKIWEIILSTTKGMKIHIKAGSGDALD